MKLATITSALLLAGSAIAAPGTAARRARAAEQMRQRKGGLINRVDGLAAVNKTEVSYSSNWAGSVVETTGVKSVTGTFTVPKPSSEGSASAWVGIDGDECETAILQTGMDFTMSNGEVSYDSWYEWYPDYAYDFSGITYSAGDSITVTVTATSKTGGTAVIKNNTKGKSVKHTFSKQTDGSLCQTDAEWIVEDYEEGNSLVEFCDFGTVAFTGASAKTSSGSTFGPSSGGVIDIKQNNKVLTSVSTSSSGVTIKYV